MADNQDSEVKSYDAPDLMPEGDRENAIYEMEMYWCFRNLIRMSALPPPSTVARNNALSFQTKLLTVPTTRSSRITSH
jgi:hypothetical protein